MVDLNSLNDEELLNLRVSELKVTMQGTDLEKAVQKLYAELDAKNLPFHPVCYLADEWFVPSGDTVVAIPFYLAHPRLKKLEEKMMLDVEGGNFDDCMKLLRHEAGHAFHHAYALHKDKRLLKTFGPTSTETPETYQPKPYSRHYVDNLDEWYAQCDADEDFAETFAVWLNPESDWEKKYQGWGALKKLRLIDEIFTGLAGRAPEIVTTDKPYSAARSQMRLSTYYQRKRKQYEEDYPDFFDADLTKIFSRESQGDLAHAFMKKYQRTIINKVGAWTGTRKYKVNDLFHSLMKRCKELGLRVNKDPQETLLDLCAYLTTRVSNYHFTGKYRGEKRT